MRSEINVKRKSNIAVKVKRDTGNEEAVQEKKKKNVT